MKNTCLDSLGGLELMYIIIRWEGRGNQVDQDRLGLEYLHIILSRSPDDMKILKNGISLVSL